MLDTLYSDKWIDTRVDKIVMPLVPIMKKSLPDVSKKVKDWVENCSLDQIILMERSALFFKVGLERLFPNVCIQSVNPDIGCVMDGRRKVIAQTIEMQKWIATLSLTGNVGFLDEVVVSGERMGHLARNLQLAFPDNRVHLAGIGKSDGLTRFRPQDYGFDAVAYFSDAAVYADFKDNVTNHVFLSEHPEYPTRFINETRTGEEEIARECIFKKICNIIADIMNVS